MEASGPRSGLELEIWEPSSYKWYSKPLQTWVCVYHPLQSHIKKRLFMFRFGDRRTQMNWVHVRNLVQAHVLAAEALTVAKGYVAVSLLPCCPHLPPADGRQGAPSLGGSWLTHISPQLKMAGGTVGPGKLGVGCLYRASLTPCGNPVM